MPIFDAVRRLTGAARERVKELSGFGVTGAVCFCIDLGLFQLLYAHTGIGAVFARLISTLVATTVAYVGNRYWSFSHRARTGVRREFVLFALINGVTLLLSLAVVAFVRHGLDQSSTLVLQIANVCSIALGTVIRYLGYRQWVFPAAPERSAAPAHVPPAAPASESRSPA